MGLLDLLKVRRGGNQGHQSVVISYNFVYVFVQVGKCWVEEQNAVCILTTITEDDAMDSIDPEFLAALPPDIQAEVLEQQRQQRRRARLAAAAATAAAAAPAPEPTAVRVQGRALMCFGPIGISSI